MFAFVISALSTLGRFFCLGDIAIVANAHAHWVREAFEDIRYLSKDPTSYSQEVNGYKRRASVIGAVPPGFWQVA